MKVKDEGIISTGRNDALKTLVGFVIFITLFFILFPLIGDKVKNVVIEIFIVATLLSFIMKYYVSSLSIWWYMQIIICIIFPTIFSAVILFNDKTTEYAWVVIVTTML